MFVTHFFKLAQKTKDLLYEMEPKFGYNGYGEFLFYRTYSRIKDFDTGEMESWYDVVIRVVEGTLSIRKDWYIKNHITWDEEYWQKFAIGFAVYLFEMKWFPAGRGLWMMGSSFVYRRGAMALANCGYCHVSNDIGKEVHWSMDALMLGVGVGFYPERDDKLRLYNPRGTEDFLIEDSREGWINCSKAICDSYTNLDRKKINPIYDEVRPAGQLIRDFGGISSGPEPLIKFHNQLVEYFERYQENNEYDSVRLKADVVNAEGCCVVAGNVRRCFPAITQIFTRNGLVCIQNVKENDQVLTLNGYKKVISNFKQGKQKLVSIILSNNQELRCTPNHKIAILDSIDGEIYWIEAQNLNPGDTVLHSFEGCSGNSNISNQEAYFYGQLNGDGSIYFKRKGGAEITFALTNNDNGHKIAHKIDGYLQSMNLTTKDSFDGDNGLHLKVYCTDLARQLLQYRIPNQCPIIPEMIYTGNRECKLSYLAGLCDADGTPSKYVLCSSVYKEFLVEVQKIAASVGICTYIITRNRPDWEWKQENCLIIKGFLSRKRAYTLINSYMVKQFPYKTESKYDCRIGLQLIDKELENKNITKTQYHQLKNCTHKVLIEYNQEFWSKVIPLQVQDVLDLGDEEETYDIEVEDEHCFFAEGILVHNSAELLKGKIRDKIFLDLKNIEINPDRAEISYMSNNSVELEAPEDFELLGEVAKRVITNGEPGVINRINMKLARVGKEDLIKYLLKEDPATGFNPLSLAA